MKKQDVMKIILEIIEELKPEKLLKESLYKNFYKFIKKLNKIYIISLGKAGYSMAETFYDFAVESGISEKIQGGFVVSPYNTTKGTLANFEILESSHPYPDFNSLYAGDRLIKVIQGLSLDIEIIFLLSGGASSLIEKTIEGIELQHLQNLTKSLLRSGAKINEINTVRKKFSLLKGGGLAKLLYPRNIYQFILNDVVGKNSEKFVSSGLLYPENVSLKRVKHILKKYNIILDFDIHSLSFPKNNKSSVKKTFVIGNNQIACEKAKNILEKNHYRTKLIVSNFSGSIEKYEFLILKTILKSINKISRLSPTAYIWGGEPTVNVQGNGLGGRNQELALRMCIHFYKNKRIQSFFENNNMIFVSIGTDGVDGPTDSAGGVVSKDTYQDIIKNQNLETIKTPEEFLKNNDSYTALSLADSLIKTGYTGTNLNDLSLLFLNFA